MRRTAPRRVVAEIARRHARKKQGSESGTCVGYPDTAVAFALEKLEIVSYYVSRSGPSRSRLKALKRPNKGPQPEARGVEGTINPCE